MNKEKIQTFYDKNYKKLFFIPIALLLISIAFLLFKFANTGEFISTDVSLKGGVTATIDIKRGINVDELEDYLKNRLNNDDLSVRELTDFGTGEQVGIIVEAGKSNVELEKQSVELKKELEEFLKIELTNENYSSEVIGSSLGESFFRELVIAVIFAFILMGITIFIIFRNFIPSIAVILAAFTDIVVTLAIMSLIDIRLSSAGIAAFLLIIGYSVDTDVLLTTRALKRRGEGNLFERMYSATTTGLTMTIATMGAVIVGLIITNSDVIRQIFLIILIALVIDLISTYLGNAAIIKWYCNKKNIT